MVTTAVGAEEHHRNPEWLPKPVQSLENQFLYTEKCSMPFAVSPGHRPAQKPNVNWRGDSDVIFPNSLKEQLCCVFFTKFIHTAWEHWHCSVWAAWQSQSHCKPHLQLPSQRVGRGSSPCAWQSTLRISGSKASFGGLHLILAAAQWLLRAPWLLLHLACPHLVLAWLCSPALLWTYLLSPLHFNLHSPFHSGTALPLVPGISQCSPGPSSG